MEPHERKGLRSFELRHLHRRVADWPGREPDGEVLPVHPNVYFVTLPEIDRLNDPGRTGPGFHLQLTEVGVRALRSPIFQELRERVVAARLGFRAAPEGVGALVILLSEQLDESLELTFLAEITEGKVQRNTDYKNRNGRQDNPEADFFAPLIADAILVEIAGHQENLASIGRQANVAAARPRSTTSLLPAHLTG